MIDTTFDLLTQVTSNSLFIFCFCNLLIAIVLLGSKSILNDDQGRANHLATSANKHQEDEEDKSAKQVCEVRLESNASMQGQVSDHKTTLADSSTNTVCSSIMYGNGSDEIEAGDDDLRARVEEFIGKVNEAWKAEFLRTTCVF